MSQSTPPTQADMTPQEALSILYRLNEAVGWHLHQASPPQEEQALRTLVWSALRTMCSTIHGEAPLTCSSSLCDVCYLRYVPLETPMVTLKPGTARGSTTLSKSPCSQCLEQLKAEGNLAEIINWETGEVTPC